MTTTESRHLLRVLQDRNIALSEADVVTAFQEKTTCDKANSWAREYLGSATLLTKEEVRFYERQGGSAVSDSVPHGRPLDDDELEAAIDSLEASTAAIDRQCQIMEQQKVALQKLKSQNTHSDSSFLAQEKRLQKYTREKAQLDLEIDELSATTKDRLRTCMKQTDATTGSLDASLNRLLEKDDRLIDGLQKLLPKLADTALDKDETQEVEQLCATLTDLSVSSIRSRLDSTYRQTLLEYTRRQKSPSMTLTDQQTKQRETLRAELEELGGEIEGLVTIVIDNQYRKSLKSGLTSARSEGHAQKAKWAEYTVTALVYLKDRLDAISGHVQHLHAHRAALRSISRTLEEAIAVTEQARPGAVNNNTPSTPTNRDRQNAAKGLKPLRLVQANISETQDPVISFLHEHNIRVGGGGGEPAAADLSKLTPLLDAANSNQTATLDALQKTTEETMTTSILQSLAKSDADLHALLSAVYASSPYGEIKLIDTQTQAALEELEHQTQCIGDEMRELDIEGIARAVKRKQEEALKNMS
ncbi:hypothetical protein SMMN14_08796 [Sphaerulina musiva]